MKIFSKKFISILILSIFLFAKEANAAAVSLMGIANNSTPISSSGADYTGKASIGYGAGLEISVVPLVLGMEIDVLSISRKYESVLGATKESYTQQFTEIPFLLRLWLGNHLSLGAGVYYAKYSGAIKKSTSNIAYAESIHSKDDFGFLSSVGIYFSILPGVKLNLDGRYTLGIRDNDTSSDELKFNDLQIISGLRIGF